MNQTIRIATRKSPLALWQANYVADRLRAHHPHLTIELIEMVTQGDLVLDKSFSKIGGKGLFVKQLEIALLEKSADIAVHSMKDVPMAFPDGLDLIAICKRDDPRDAFVSNHYTHLAKLPENAIVGTSSLRRKCQLKLLRPDLQIRDLRGNVGTRLGKLDQGDYDAIILAAAGLKRLELTARIRSYLPISDFLPAAGQGAIGIEARINDIEIAQLLAPLNDPKTHCCLTAERAMNRVLNGGCQIPIGCHATLDHQRLRVSGFVGSEDGSHRLYHECQGAANDAEKLGIELAEKLLARGAEKLLAQIKPQNA